MDVLNSRNIPIWWFRSRSNKHMESNVKDIMQVTLFNVLSLLSIKFTDSNTFSEIFQILYFRLTKLISKQ